MILKRNIKNLTTEQFDVLIIGGGIFGACAAWDATLRGLKVALIEKEDFCSGVSANSFKIVHGGMRYLQHADIKRLRSSCHERSAMLRIAPHLVQPLPILVPTYGHGKSGKAFLATGLYLYDFLTFDRNKKITDPARHIPLTRLLSRDEVLNEYPQLDPDGLTGGVVFFDGRMYNPTRLVLAFIQSAAAMGACVANYIEATEFIEEGGRIKGVIAYDHHAGRSITINSKTVLNASGPWAEHLLKTNFKKEKQGTYSRDACFVIKRRFESDYTIAIQGRTKDPDALLSRPARHLFMSPWRNYTLVGVWHVVTEMHPEKITVTADDLKSFMDEINWAYPQLNLTLSDVTMWNAGLVPFGENEPGSEHLSYGKRSHVIDHQQTDNLQGLVTLIGVRYTMGRADSAQAIDLVQQKLGLPVKQSATDYQPIHGGSFDMFEDLVQQIDAQFDQRVDKDDCKALAHNYGNEYGAIHALTKEQPELSELVNNSNVLKAEVIHAIRNEMALKLSDIVFRRTDLATGGHPGLVALEQSADLSAKELGWNDEQREAELKLVLQHFPEF